MADGGGVRVISSEEQHVAKEVARGQELPLYGSTEFVAEPRRPEGISPSAELVRRRTTVAGVSDLEEASAQHSDYRRMDLKSRRAPHTMTWMERVDWALLRAAGLASRGVDRWVPARFNPRNPESGRTRWGAVIQRHVLDSGKHTRRAIGLGTLVVAAMVLLLVANAIPWRGYFAMDAVPVFADERGRSMRNVEVPHYLRVDADASDYKRAQHLVRRSTSFPAVTRDWLLRGYREVELEYGRRANVSFNMLRDALNRTMIEGGYSCLCAAHLGIPLNVVELLTVAPTGLPNTRRLLTQTLYEPTLTLGSKETRTTTPIESNIYYAPRAPGVVPEHANGPLAAGQTFTITYPNRVALRYVTEQGFEALSVSGHKAACVVFCCELSQKRALIDRVRGGVVVTDKDGSILTGLL